MGGVKMASRQIIYSEDIHIFKEKFHISIITLDEEMPGFPCKFRIRGPKKNEPWFDVTINNRMYSIGWL